MEDGAERSDARAACISLDQNSNKNKTFRNRVVPWVGFNDTSKYIYYYCCKSFTVLVCHQVTVGGWIASWVSLLYYVLLYCCRTGLWVGRLIRSCRVLLSCVHTGSWVFVLFSPAIPAPCWHSSAHHSSNINSNTVVFVRTRIDYTSQMVECCSPATPSSSRPNRPGELEQCRTARRPEIGCLLARIDGQGWVEPQELHCEQALLLLVTAVTAMTAAVTAVTVVGCHGVSLPKMLAARFQAVSRQVAASSVQAIVSVSTSRFAEERSPRDGSFGGCCYCYYGDAVQRRSDADVNKQLRSGSREPHRNFDTPREIGIRLLAC